MTAPALTVLLTAVIAFAPVPQPRTQLPIPQSRWKEGIQVRWYDPYDRTDRRVTLKRHPHHGYWCVHWSEVETVTVYEKTLNYYRALPDGAKLFPITGFAERTEQIGGDE